MPLFNEQVPKSQFEIDPTYLPDDKKWLASLLGFKSTGERNTWGKISRFLGPTSIGTNVAARGLMGGRNSDFEENVRENMSGDVAGLKTTAGIGVGIGGAITGNPQMLSSGVQTAMAGFPEALSEGADLSNDWSTKWFAGGGEIDPNAQLNVSSQPKNMSRLMDFSYEDVLRIRKSGLTPDDLARRAALGGMPPIVVPGSIPPPKSFTGIYTDNPNTISFNNSMLTKENLAPNVWFPPRPGDDEAAIAMGGFKKGGSIMNNKLSGEDIAMIDKWTGKKVGEVSYGERIMDKNANETMKELAAEKRYYELGKYIAGEMKTQQDGGEEEQYKRGGTLTPAKARAILKDGTIRGRKITEKQRKFFGAIADEEEEYQSGGTIREVKQYRDGGDIGARISGAGVSTKQPGGMEDDLWSQLGGWGQLYNVGQFVTGMLGANDPLPQFQKPEAWTQYVMDQQNRAKYGMSNAERGEFQRFANQGLTSGLNASRELSGGNSAFAVGDASRFAGNHMDNALKFASLNEKVKQDAITQYGNVLLRDIGFDKDAFDQKYQEALLKKSSAAELARTGLQGAIDQADYAKSYGKGSLHQEYLRSMIDLNKRLSGIDYSGWLDDGATAANPAAPSPLMAPGTGMTTPPNPWGIQGSEFDLPEQYNPWLQSLTNG